jgi:hypothetical protein
MAHPPTYERKVCSEDAHVLSFSKRQPTYDSDGPAPPWGLSRAASPRSHADGDAAMACAAGERYVAATLSTCQCLLYLPAKLSLVPSPRTRTNYQRLSVARRHRSTLALAVGADPDSNAAMHAPLRLIRARIRAPADQSTCLGSPRALRRVCRAAKRRRRLRRAQLRHALDDECVAWHGP